MNEAVGGRLQRLVSPFFVGPVCCRNASSRPAIPPRAGASGEASPQLTAFFTSALILASSAAVNFFNAKAVGHMAPSSRFDVSLKASVAYLVLNFCAL